MRMLGATVLAGLMQDPDPRGQDGQPGIWALLAATGFLPLDVFFFSRNLGSLVLRM